MSLSSDVAVRAFTAVPEVGCAGILVEDTFCGPMPALPPEGALMALEDFTVCAGGCAANTAIDLVHQGITVDVAGCVGHDDAGNFLLRTFETQGVGISQVTRVLEHRTSQTVILLVSGQDRRYLHTSGANRAFSVGHIDRDWLGSLRVFYLGGLFVLPGIDFADLTTLLQFCRRARVLTVVDVVLPHGVSGMNRLAPLLPLIDVFVPNDDEARAFTGVTEPRDQLRAFARAGANTVIITRGARGSAAARGTTNWQCGAYQMECVDPSGSGDAFASGVILGLLLDWDMPRTLRYASALGASVTRSPGTTDSVFSAAEAEAFLAEHPLDINESAVS